jgi:hypothetical protein
MLRLQIKMPKNSSFLMFTKYRRYSWTSGGPHELNEGFRASGLSGYHISCSYDLRFSSGPPYMLQEHMNRQEYRAKKGISEQVTGYVLQRLQVACRPYIRQLLYIQLQCVCFDDQRSSRT